MDVFGGCRYFVYSLNIANYATMYKKAACIAISKTVAQFGTRDKSIIMSLQSIDRKTHSDINSKWDFQSFRTVQIRFATRALQSNMFISIKFDLPLVDCVATRTRRCMKMPFLNLLLLAEHPCVQFTNGLKGVIHTITIQVEPCTKVIFVEV